MDTSLIFSAALDVTSNAVGTVADFADPAAMDNNKPGEGGEVSLMTSREFWLSALLLGFGLVVIAAQLFYLRGTDAEGKRAVSSESGIRLSIVSMIIVGALILIASGYSENQIGPAMGLFGTVAGYLIGRQDRSS
jgi:hypothetical protein